LLSQNTQTSTTSRQKQLLATLHRSQPRSHSTAAAAAAAAPSLFTCTDVELFDLHACCDCSAAAINNDRVMRLSLVVAKYPDKRYLTPEAINAISDAAKRERYIAANERLQAALDSYINLVNLLHTTGDKVLNLSLLNLENLKPETPDTSLWEVCAVR
jgi:hypothetical protein